MGNKGNGDFRWTLAAENNESFYFENWIFSFDFTHTGDSYEIVFI